MSKFTEAVEMYQKQVADLGLDVSDDLLTKVAKSLVPSIYNADASKISGSDPEEITRMKNNFLIKKMGMNDGPELDSAIAEVMEKMGKSNRSKHRAVVYALLAKKFGKEDIYS